MGDKEGKSKGDEEKKLSAILERYDALLPKVADTQKACDSLWKSYQVSLFSIFFFFQFLKLIKKTSLFHSKDVSQSLFKRHLFLVNLARHFEF